jgi:hypothetical protein
VLQRASFFWWDNSPAAVGSPIYEALHSAAAKLSSFACTKLGPRTAIVAIVQVQQLEDGSDEPASLNLLSLCWPMRREKPKPRKETARADLGQTEAELEKAGKERMDHMQGEKSK